MPFLKRHKISVCLICLTFILVSSYPCFAQMPTPERKQLSLGTLKQAIEKKEQEKKDLEQQVKKDESDLKSLQKNLVRYTEQTKTIDRKLEKLKQRKQELSKDHDRLVESLKQHRHKTAQVVSAAIHLKQLPPQSYMLSTKTPYELGLVQTTLSSVFPHALHQTEDVSKELKKLSIIEEELREQEALIAENQKALNKKQADVRSLLKERKRLVSKRMNLIEEHNSQIAAYAERAKTMEELISRLSVHKPKILNKPQFSQELPKRGSKRLPAEGVVLVGFGQMYDIGAPSEGLRIKTKPKTITVAPMGGVVRYIGSFKQYQNLIIIEHKGEYHSLIAGLDQINVSLGQSVIAGEPLGITRSQSASSILYYELRHKGRPINPI